MTGFFLFCFVFCFVLFVCLFFVLFLFFASHLLKQLKFVLGLPKWTIFTGKNHISGQGKIGKIDFSPTEKYSSYASAPHFNIYNNKFYPLGPRFSNIFSHNII